MFIEIFVYYSNPHHNKNTPIFFENVLHYNFATTTKYHRQNIYLFLRIDKQYFRRIEWWEGKTSTVYEHKQHTSPIQTSRCPKLSFPRLQRMRSDAPFVTRIRRRSAGGPVVRTAATDECGCSVYGTNLAEKCMALIVRLFACLCWFRWRRALRWDEYWCSGGF